MASKSLGVIVTMPPHADFLVDVVAHPLVRAIRLNTVMPVHEPLPTVLERLASRGVPVFIDLKTRQLRVTGYGLPPFTEIVISHPITVETPVDVFFADGNERAELVSVDTNRLILADGPRRIVGPGESINIVDPSLRIDGFLTDTDKRYIEAAASLGLHDYMVSYIQRPQDIAAVTALDPEARCVLKIEDNAGLAFADTYGNTLGRLMVGRGDLYVELCPHELPAALRELIAADPQAIAASRLFPSLASQPVPAPQDVTDAAFLLELGYRTFMLGDEVCLRRETTLAALNALDALAKDYLQCESP